MVSVGATFRRNLYFLSTERPARKRTPRDNLAGPPTACRTFSGFPLAAGRSSFGGIRGGKNMKTRCDSAGERQVK